MFTVCGDYAGKTDKMGFNTFRGLSISNDFHACVHAFMNIFIIMMFYSHACMCRECICICVCILCARVCVSHHNILFMQVNRKRHIGNDITCLVFLEGPDCHFNPLWIKSNFLHCFIVVQLLSETTSEGLPLYRVSDLYTP